MSLKRIGMFGGTFNPPHIAHLIAGELAVERFALDKLIFVPANIPPHKTKHTLPSPEDRLAMTNLAIDGNDHFEASDIEIVRSGTSYSIDTIKALKERYQPESFYLFIGMDNVAIFRTWRQSEDILKEAKIVAMLRPTHDIGAMDKSLLQKLEVLEIPLLEISSTEIRERVRKSQSIRYYVPDSVRAYIESKGLYKD